MPAEPRLISARVGGPPKRQESRKRWRYAIVLSLAIPAHAQSIDFGRQIRPILEQNCIACHGPAKSAGNLRVDTATAISKAIIPKSPDKSPLYTTIKSGKMPPGGVPLPKTDVALIHDWIAAGAPWPEGQTLRDRQSGGMIETKLVKDLRKRIAAGTKETQPADMKPYKSEIPGLQVSFEMVPIPAGDFTMGTPDAEPGHKPDEAPPHKVHIDPFWMGKYEVAWDEYRLFMFAQAAEKTAKDQLVDAVTRPTRPYVEMSFGMGINGFPAISMTQHAANKYAEWLSAKTGQFYRLPTEAEWEYACRAGTSTAYFFGNDAAQLGDYAVFNDNSNGKYQKVGTKKPNPWGLYDILGNVMEWTLDQFEPYPASPATSPWVKAKKAYPESVRGGSWADDSDRLRCGARVPSDPSWKMQDPQLPKSIWYHTDAQWLGFRLVRPLKVPGAAEMYSYWNNGVERE